MFQELTLIERAKKHSDRVAIMDACGAHTYGELLESSSWVADALLVGMQDMLGERVAFLSSPDFNYVAMQWGIWRSGGIAVPLAVSYPRPELEYVIRDSGATVVVSDPHYESTVRPIAKDMGLRFVSMGELATRFSGSLPTIDASRNAMILYTSGTTKMPKGVVTTHMNIESQVAALITAWGWDKDDHILNVLPLHHVHGIINVVTCSMWAGALCEMTPRFDANQTWKAFEQLDVTLFMAVPTIYSKLITEWQSATRNRQKLMSKACSNMRLMISGSAALPAQILSKWRSISGHTLLERYGMTEAGMILSNPLNGLRVPGHVGYPLDGVEVRLVNDQGMLVERDAEGELEIKGPGVFKEYWMRVDETKESFRGEWFSTGDIAVIDDSGYRILGRKSVDIIKTGGYKVSALEIEAVLLTHPDVDECAVVGIDDVEWGEKVSAAIVLNRGSGVTSGAIRVWAKQRLAVYKAPSNILFVVELPRNAMGKVFKPKVIDMFLSASSA